MSKKKAAAMMEFRTVKRIDNSRLVRHVEPAKQKNLFKTAGLGGVVALLYVWRDALPPETTGPVLAVIAALTMTVGNLVALRQRHAVRLLAWSSIAQSGYMLVPLGAAGKGDVAGAVTLLVDGTPTAEVAVPANGAAPTTWAVAFTDLRRPLAVTEYVPVTLEFQRAGRVTLQVPVFAGDNGLQDREPEQDPYHVE